MENDVIPNTVVRLSDLQLPLLPLKFISWLSRTASRFLLRFDLFNSAIQQECVILLDYTRHTLKFRQGISDFPSSYSWEIKKTLHCSLPPLQQFPMLSDLVFPYPDVISVILLPCSRSHRTKNYNTAYIL